MDEQITRAEQNLLLLQTAIPSSEKFYIWCYADDGHCIATSCPAEDRDLLERTFSILGGVEKAIACASSPDDRPSMIGSPIGMQWAIAFETERRRNLFFIMGPVFYAPPAETQIRKILSPYRDSLERGCWATELLRRLPDMPVMPFAIFIRYATMVHNMLTGRQSDVSFLYDPASALEAPRPIAPPRKRDRTKVYLAEQALLGAVRTGDMNYQSALQMSSSLSHGVHIQGREPLQQAKISVIVFTSLVCRAAMEGGLSPEIAYPLGDSYIESVLSSRDSGELSRLSLAMYHDFICRVHHLRSNPALSPAIQKCCDYIELSLTRKIQAADLAALTGYSEYYLTEKFKKETGMPLLLYIRHARIERAKTLLATSELSIAQIAEQLAFSTPNYFIRCFREDTGCSPAQYRKQTKNR